MIHRYQHTEHLRVGVSRCACDVCRALGDAATHNGPEHDTRIDQVLQFGERTLHILGGTTRCARVMMQTLLGRNDLTGLRVAELGAGTGLMTQALAVLGAEVWTTDQAPVLDVLEENIERNLTPEERSRVHVMPLYWGNMSEIDALKSASAPGLDLVLGSDLIFAQENNGALVHTVHALCPPGKRFTLAYTQRFAFEEDFFVDLAQSFVEESWSEEGDVSVFTWCRRA